MCKRPHSPFTANPQIRAKRLAKLASRGSPPSGQPQPEQQPLREQPQEPPHKPHPTEHKPEADPQPQPQPQPQPPQTEPSPDALAKWLSLEIESIFGASVSPQPPLIHLESLASELTAESPLAPAHIESVFMEILTELGAPSTPLEYLHQVYVRAFQSKRTLPKRDPLFQQKNSTLNHIIQLSCLFGLICFQEVDMFLHNQPSDLMVRLLALHSDMSAFFIDMVHKSVEQGSLLDFLNVVVPQMSVELYTLDVSKRQYSDYVALYETLVTIKPVAACFSQIDHFEPRDRTDPLLFENTTLLGSLFKLSALKESVGEFYFGSDVATMSPVQINSSYGAIQNEAKVLGDRLFYIVDKLIRGSAETRNALMKWWGAVVNLNHLRRGSHADLLKLCLDGFMFNVTTVLVRLCLPFLQYPQYAKIDKVDIDYFGRTLCLLNVEEESRINASVQEAQQYWQTALGNNDGATNFILDCFYLTLGYLHYGLGGVFNHYDRLKAQIKQMEQRLAMVNDPQANPMMHMLRAQAPALTKALNALRCLKHSVQALASFGLLQHEVFDFIVGSTVVFTRIIDSRHQYPAQRLEVPIFQIERVSQLDDQDFLKTKSPQPWRYFPEFILEGIINYCTFVSKFRENPLLTNDSKLGQFVEFAVILLRCPELVGNPHMKAQLIEVLFIGLLPMADGRPGFFAHIFNSNELVMNNLLYALLDIYVMVEKTGALSQFYDKFNSRYYILVILEGLWTNELYRQQLLQYSKSNIDFFVRFIAKMLNDMTYLLDETFNELQSIHELQVETKRRQAGAATPELGTDDELRENLALAERKAKSYMGLANKLLELFKLFTLEVPRGFVLPELVDRLASMLNYNLAAMVGPKCLHLKVEDPQKYDFDPKRTLADLCQIYCNLSHQESFVTAVARDGRLFNVELFAKADRILLTRTYTPPKVLQALREFATKAEAKRQEDNEEEMELGEVPDEFLDPLMFTLMEDPVILPSLHVSVDRSTIKLHLLNDPTDPFNRMALKMDDVIDNVELRERIQQFKRSKHGA